MRSWLLVAVVIAGCDDEGAHLTLHAPDGPLGATSFQVVLASPDLVPVITDQRSSPSQLAVETVTYYLQRASAGVTGSITNVDGFTILVEPDAAVAETAFIPFVLLYDAQHQLVGVGTYHADAQTPQPSPILIKHGEVDLFPIDVEPLVEVADTRPVATGDAMQVECARDDQTTFPSGVVWRPRAGGELRLLLPDDPTSDDATSRRLDLDCDDHAVDQDAKLSTDCDDTRARFHDNAKELCDGEDWNCDSILVTAVPCSGSTTCSAANTGFALCDDATGMQTSCTDNAACSCGPGGNGTCSKCILTFGHGATATEVTPCQPGVGVLSAQNSCETGPCIVDVLGSRNGWTVQVAPTTQGPFGPAAVGVIDSFALKVKRPEGPGFSMPGTAGGSLGTADIVIISPNGTKRLQSIDLELTTAQTTCAGTGPYAMTCTP